MKQRVRAEKFLNDAEKTLKKSTWFSSSTEQKYEDAAELYDQAANAYKVGQMNSEAGVAYMKAAELYRDKLSNQMEGSKALSNAGLCISKLELIYLTFGTFLRFVSRLFTSCRSFVSYQYCTFVF